MRYRIVEGAEAMTVGEVARLLKTTYWAGNRPEEQIGTSMRHSDCYGIRLEGSDELVGFARVLTDRATTYYLSDVVIDEAYRGRGLGKALVGHITSRPAYEGLLGILLTRDAHGLYRHFGFEPANDRAMTKRRNP